MKIYITGCARSGTTLVRNLFTAFNCDVINREIHLSLFVTRKACGRPIVGKRATGTVYSHAMLRSKTVAEQLNLIKKHNIKIVNVIRNRADVIDSWHRAWDMGRQGAFNYDFCMDSIKEAPIINIHYEDILSNPDKEQRMLADKLDLTIIHNWSEYPKFVPSKFNLQNEYSLRKIGERYIFPDSPHDDLGKPY